MNELSNRKCISCEGDMPPLTREEVEILLKQVAGWTISDDVKKISKEIKTKNFKTSLELANQIGEVAEAEGHHPDLLVSWGKLTITLTTHAMKGLSENDFIMAAKIDALFGAPLEKIQN